MPHEETALLDDIRRASALIQQFVANRTANEYGSDDLLRSAVERQFIVIGEALNRLEKLDPDIVNKISDCRQIIGFRNLLVHGYQTIDDQIVWQTIQTNMPELQKEVEALIDTFS